MSLKCIICRQILGCVTSATSPYLLEVSPESGWFEVMFHDGSRYSSQFKNNHFAEMCCGTEAGSYLRLIDFCITQLKAQGPSRTCNESKEEEEEGVSGKRVVRSDVPRRLEVLNPKP